MDDVRGAFLGYFGSSRIAHGSLRDVRRDSSHYNIQVHVLIKSICKLLHFLLSFNACFVNDAQFNQLFCPLCLGLFQTVLYVWGYFGHKKPQNN